MKNNKYYLIGIKGSGMSTLAMILKDLGNDVIGYDDSRLFKFTQFGLDERNINIYYETPQELSDEHIVIYSGSFKETHPEIKKIKKRNLKIKPYQEMLGDLSKSFKTISIAGTHGKTTTSLMLTQILEQKGPLSYFIGDGTGKATKENDLFILESCEFKKNFLSYTPTDVIVTNLELDHTETYPTLKDLINTFNIFVEPIQNHLVLNGDQKTIRSLKTKTKPIYFGLKENNDVYATNIVKKHNVMSFDVYWDKEFFANFTVNFFGEYMILNALAAITMAKLKGASIKDIKNGLKNFKGAKRRFNEYSYNDIIIVDDYAHHPTEIEVTIKAAKMKYPTKKIVAVFLPNTYSRIKEFKKEFIKSLKLADKTYVMAVESDRETSDEFPGISSDMIINEIQDAELISVEETSKLMIHQDSVVLFMSCTNIAPIINEYKKLLEAK